MRLLRGLKFVPFLLGVLLAACLALMVGAGPLYRYMEATAAALADRSSYIDIVRSAPRAGEDPS